MGDCVLLLSQCVYYIEILVKSQENNSEKEKKS